jgi:TonB family protein
MNKLLLSIFFALLLSGSAPATRPSPATDRDWERFRVAQEGFSVLFPEWPAVVDRGQYRAGPAKGARDYAAYSDGVVYFLVSFDNPHHEQSLDYFVESQLRVNELRNSEISPGTEISIGSVKGKQFSLTKSDPRKSFSYPGILRMYETKNRVLAQLAIGKDATDPAIERFLQSLEISEKPNGRDIGSGAPYTDAAPGNDSPLKPSDVSRKVLILIKPEPRYTEEERRRRLRGGVVLRGVLSSSGKVTNLSVVSGLPELAASALEVARKIYFIPAVKDGRFVSTVVELQYNFDIY